MKITITDIVKNGIWLTFPILLFSFSLMNRLPAALTPALFNQGIPDVLAKGENIVRILVFAMPAFFSVGISTKTQKQGLALYLAGVALYYLSYLALIFFPRQYLEYQYGRFRGYSLHKFVLDDRAWIAR